MLLKAMKRSAISLLGLAAALLLCELCARFLLQPPLGDRVEISDLHGTARADCYPRARGISFPFDVGMQQDAVNLFQRFRSPVMVWPQEPGAKLDPEHLSLTASVEEGIARLRESAPLCVLYDTSVNSPRIFSPGPTGSATVAVLGDSFAFGQGVRDEESFPVLLGREAGIGVRSFAKPGANLKEVLVQFQQMLLENKQRHFSRVLYLYVLNDPFLIPTLGARLNELNDFMNVRLGAAPDSPDRLVRFLGRLANKSALARAALRAYAATTLSRETVAFYREVHDPALNAGMDWTFENLRTMRNQAGTAGLEFEVFVYPLMLDMRAYPLKDAHRHLAELAVRYGIRLTDLLPFFEAHPGETLTVHPIDMHPNGTAQGIAARAVADILRATPVSSSPKNGK